MHEDLNDDADCTVTLNEMENEEIGSMTDIECELLVELEAEIQESWWAMGRAYSQIKERKLYRQTKDGERQTWEQYCRNVHGLSKQQVDKIIRAAVARTTLEMETKVSVFPETVSQAAELSGLTPDRGTEKTVLFPDHDLQKITEQRTMLYGSGEDSMSGDRAVTIPNHLP